MIHRQITSLGLIVVVLFMTSLVGPGESVLYVHGENLSVAQDSPPGLVQFPWAPDSSFVVQNATSYFTAFNNAIALKEQFVIRGIGGLNGTVSLTATVPRGINLNIDPSTVVLRGWGSPPGFTSQGFYNLTLATTKPGTYSVVVTATNGTISNSLTVTAIVTDGPDFVMIPSFPYSSITTGRLGNPEGYAGRQLTQAILVWSTGFQGMVNLSTQVSPPGPSATLSLSTNAGEPGNLASPTISRHVQADGKNYTTLILNSTNAADYAVTVNGSAGAHTHSVNVSFTLRDFTLSLSTTPHRVLDAGGSLLSRINVKALNGFSGLVNFTIWAPIGFSVMLSSENVTGSGAVAMKVTNNSANPGIYNITLNAETRYYLLTHSVTLTIEVRSLLSVLAYTLPWIAAGTIATIGAAVYLLRRRKTSKSLAGNPVQ